MLAKVPFDLRHLFSNTSWLLITEITAKISRLAVIISLAAVLTAEEYGTVMLALACHEVFKLTLRSGAGAQIVQCDQQRLASYVQNGFILQWIVCLALMLIQAGLAFSVGQFYENPQVTELLFWMAGVYSLYPLVSIKVFLIQRAGNMRYFSIRNATCIIAENFSIALFAMLDLGVMSVVWGKWVFVITWLLLFSFAPTQRFGLGFSLPIFLTLGKTSGQLFSTELTKALRGQMDMLVGARILSPEMFGLYSFAKSAGVGLSQSISNAFNAALYPYLCSKYRSGGLPDETRNVYLLTALVASVFALQAIAVPLYVPILFEQHWQQNYLVVMLLCFAALPALFVDTHCCLLRARASYKAELAVRVSCLAVSTAGLLMLPAETPETFALNILLLSFAWLAVVIISHTVKPAATLTQTAIYGSQSNE